MIRPSFHLARRYVHLNSLAEGHFTFIVEPTRGQRPDSPSSHDDMSLAKMETYSLNNKWVLDG